MSTLSIIEDIKDSISPINQQLTIKLIDLFREEELLDNSLIGNDGEDGINIRWPKSRLFCDISNGKIYISVVPPEPAKLDDMKIEEYEDALSACNRISSILGS